ncbi:hypothetical protein [Pseudoalteromonas piscicida]|uniref:Uncharacterized protein n=1 Tax=Pseudoalteromonas piscicida TaxID=43662 RepID=A0A2A5JN14_PSEO7|nr:hypothetical protein [Pseudoalteromonas piscicida]PCK30818.1 hypothetical protein CEX98_15650 [Pseudoalteromonas piscicida]
MSRVVAIVALLLSGCSTPTLHIFESGLDDGTRAKLVQALAKRDIHYRFTELPVPQEYENARLNIPPMTSGDDWLRDIEYAVKEIGFNRLTVSEFNMERHRYTPNNAGLYLVQNRVAQTLPGLLFAHQCQDDSIQLQLKPNGYWQQVGTQYQGRWNYESSFLTLTWRERPNQAPYQQVYAEHEHTVQTLQGPKPAKTFTRQQLFDRPVPVFNCDLQVIFAE